MPKGVTGFQAEMIPGTVEKRRKQVILNLNVDEWEKFIQLCERQGISRSEGVRRMVRKVIARQGKHA